MIDVFKIKKGDTIKFRNGEVHTVAKAIKYTELWVEQHGCKNCHSYGDFGGRYYLTGQSAWDIVEHIPKEDEEYKPSAEWMAKWGRKDEEPAQDEMTMRDQFAMSALNGLVIGTNNWRGTSPEELAEVSYSLADAMMKNRKKNG